MSEPLTRCDQTTGAACIEVTARLEEIERRRRDGRDADPLLERLRQHLLQYPELPSPRPADESTQ